MNKHILIFLGTCLVLAGSASLPSYVKKCKRDADFDKCALASAKAALKPLLKGEKSLQIPPLAPLKLPFIQLESTESLQLNLTDLDINGLETTEVKNVHVDFDNKKIQLDIHLLKVQLKGTYHIDGKILILPIKGDGPGALEIDDADFTYSFVYDLYDKNGKQFSKLGKDDFSFKINNKASFRLDNLFNGDQRLGDEMNKFLNENWADVIKEFQPVISSTIASVCKQIAGNIFDRVAYDDLFEN